MDKLDTSEATLGSFNLPFSHKGFVHQFAAGVPCEIPRAALFPWLRNLERVCQPAIVGIPFDHRIAQITSVKVIPKEAVEV